MELKADERLLHPSPFTLHPPPFPFPYTYHPSFCPQFPPLIAPPATTARSSSSSNPLRYIRYRYVLYILHPTSIPSSTPHRTSFPFHSITPYLLYRPRPSPHPSPNSMKNPTLPRPCRPRGAIRYDTIRYDTYSMSTLHIPPGSSWFLRVPPGSSGTLYLSFLFFSFLSGGGAQLTAYLLDRVELWWARRFLRHVPFQGSCFGFPVRCGAVRCGAVQLG